MVAAQEDAEKVLAEFWKAGALPVDPVLVASRMGVDVRVGKLPDDVSGALVKEIGSDPVILLEENDHANRQRFTCAHELGHYLRRAGEDHYEYVDWRDRLASEGTDPEEVFANQFAASLLMPESIVRELHSPELEVWQLAKKFAVSPEAMKFRLQKLGLGADE